MSTDINTRQDQTNRDNPRESHQTVSSRNQSSSHSIPHSATPLAVESRARHAYNMFISNTPRFFLILIRILQVCCSLLVLAAGCFSIVRFGISKDEFVIVEDGPTQFVNVDYESIPTTKGDWRPILLVVISSISLVAFPVLTFGRHKRISVLLEVILLVLWTSFMTLYVPTITAPFDPNCLHPNPPFEFVDDPTKQTQAVGLDIGRNTSSPANSSSSLTSADSAHINSDIKSYCVMSQVGVAAGLIVIIFTFISILLLLLLSYQATDILIERRALELFQHHSLPSMVASYTDPSVPLSMAYNSISNAINPARSAPTADEEAQTSNRNQQPQNPQSPVTSGPTAHSYSEKIDPQVGSSRMASAAAAVTESSRTNHERIRTPQTHQLHGWVTGGYQVTR